MRDDADSAARSITRRLAVPAGVSACFAFVAISHVFLSVPDELKLFGRADVLIVCILASLPLCISIATRVSSLAICAKLGIAVTSLAAILVLFDVSNDLRYCSLMGPAGSDLVRGLVAMSAVSPVLVLWIGFTESANVLAAATYLRRVQCLFLVLAFVLPGVYVDSVSRTLSAGLQQSLSSQRVLLSLQTAKTLHQLRPWSTADETPLANLIVSLDERRTELENTLNELPSQQRSIRSISRRTTALVQLDRLDQALVTLEPLLSGQYFHPASFDIYGLCFQRLGDPVQSLVGYQMAIAYWSPLAESNQKRQSLASAWKGVAFAARQLDNRAKEEQAYRALVRVEPSATNFLLAARCYQSHGKMDLAVNYAKRAVAVDSSTHVELTAIMSEIFRDHFGCLRGDH